jgi:DNA-binding phage protein
MQAMIKTAKFDLAEHLTTPGRIAALLTEAFESNDLDMITSVLDAIARATGKTIGHPHNPELGDIRTIMGAAGVKLVAEPIEKVA